MVKIGESNQVPEPRRPVPYPPAEALLALYRRRGPVIDAGVGGHGYVLLLGAAANKFVFANADAFSWPQAFEARDPVAGPTALIRSEGAEHQRRRNAVQPALRHGQVQQYVQIMAANADAVIDTWRRGRRLDIYQQFRSAIRRSTTESLFGQRMAAHDDFLGEQLQPLINMTRRTPPVAKFQRRVGAPAWRRAAAARARIDALIDAEIGHARANPGANDGGLATLVNGRSNSSETLSDNEIRDQVVSLISAGYETTSGAMAWAIYTLLTTPGAWCAAADEAKNVLGDRPLTAGDLTALTYINGVVHETLRLYPPGVISARKVIRELRFDGHRIQAGRQLIYSPYVTHRLPEVWPEPTEFRPQRWDPDAPDYRKPAPYEFITFGGGLHRCVGSAMATTELTVMLARLVARTTLRLPPQRIRARTFTALRPRPGLIVELTAQPVPAQPR